MEISKFRNVSNASVKKTSCGCQKKLVGLLIYKKRDCVLRMVGLSVMDNALETSPHAAVHEDERSKLPQQRNNVQSIEVWY